LAFEKDSKVFRQKSLYYDLNIKTRGKKMENGIHSQEKSYWSREVAELLGISDSTLRRYSLILEQNGYRFLRDDNNRRAFLERDVIALRKFQEMAKSSDMTLEDAALAVISAIKEAEIKGIVPSVAPTTHAINHYNQRYDDMVGKLQQLIEHNLKQETFNRFLLDRLEKQEIIIETILKETQLQLVATQEEELLLERQKRISNMITQKRVESKLETEALELWQQRPESERMKKVFFFRKEEDKEKKEQFIRVYINNHFEERFKQEYQLGDLYSLNPVQKEK
jgi:DNA-binding transcriptional MerR regulator